MKYIVLIVLLFGMTAQSQVGVGTTTPSNAATLEVNSFIDGTYHGLIPARVPSEVERDLIPATPTDKGLLVYVEDIDCLQIWNGTDWEPITCNNSKVWVNEFHYSNLNADSEEGVEIAGPAGFNLLGYTVVLYDGVAGANQGLAYRTLNLAGTIDDEGTGFGALFFFSEFIQDGGPGTAGTSAADGFAFVDPDGVVLEFYYYEASPFVAMDGPAAGMTALPMNNLSMVPQFEPGDDSAAFTLQRQGTGSKGSDFHWLYRDDSSPINKKGEINEGQTVN